MISELVPILYRAANSVALSKLRKQNDSEWVSLVKVMDVPALGICRSLLDY
jgi:hypothetical protein